MNDFNYFFSLLILLILFKNIKTVCSYRCKTCSTSGSCEICDSGNYLSNSQCYPCGSHIVKHVHIMNNVMFVIQDIIYLDIHVNNVAQVVRPVHALLLIVPPVNQDNIYQAFLAILALVNVKPVLVLPTVNLVKVDIF